MTPPLVNWAGTHTFTAPRVHRPNSVSEVQTIVAGSRRARALGSTHSFNAIADTGGDLISIADLPATLDLDSDAGLVSVAAGIRYGELAQWLHAQGFALANLGSLPHISVAGACATGTHGSGDGNGVLATSVREMDLVTADGDRVTLNARTDPDFAGTVVALGVLGIVTRLTLAVQPAFQMRQDVFENLPYAAARDHFDRVAGAGYSVSMLTSWRDARFDQVWVKSRLDAATPPADLRDLGATAATTALNPVPGMPPDNCTAQLGIPGPWHERLPHFRLDFTPSSGAEIQSEFLVPREHAVAALDAVADLGPVIAPLLQVCEIRTIAADDLWLSPAYGRDTCAIHFTFARDMARLLPVLARIEEALAPFDPRPHWGKVFTATPDTVTARHPRLADFVELRERWDPDHTFGNEFVAAYLD